MQVENDLETLRRLCKDVRRLLNELKRSLKVVFGRGTLIKHRCSHSPKRHMTMYYRARNHLLFVNKNLPLKSRVLTTLRNCLIILVHMAAILRRRMRPKESLGNLLRGVKDYYAGRFGKLEAEKRTEDNQT